MHLDKLLHRLNHITDATRFSERDHHAFYALMDERVVFFDMGHALYDLRTGTIQELVIEHEGVEYFAIDVNINQSLDRYLSKHPPKDPLPPRKQIFSMESLLDFRAAINAGDPIDWGFQYDIDLDVPPELRVMLRELAEKRGVSVHKLMVEALDSFFIELKNEHREESPETPQEPGSQGS